MHVAGAVSHRGTCSRLQVGALVARDGRILVTGYNGAPAGLDHCRHVCDCHTSDEGPHSPRCATKRPCEVSVHAEANAIAFAARFGISLADGELFTTASPCLACAQLVVNAGILRVVFSEEFRDKRGLELLRTAGVMAEMYDR